MTAESEAAYRAELEQVLKFFGDKRVLNATEIMKYTGKSRDWCKKTFGIGRSKEISATQFARMMIHI